VINRGLILGGGSLRKGHYLSVLLIAVFGVIFVLSIEAGPWGPVGSATAGLHGAVQIGSGGEGVATSGLRAGPHYVAVQGRKPSLNDSFAISVGGSKNLLLPTNEERIPLINRKDFEFLWKSFPLLAFGRITGF